MVIVGYSTGQWQSGTLREWRVNRELTEGICCPAVSVEPHYLPLWCSSRGCQRTAWSLGRPTPPVGLVTKTRGSSHCYGDSMHPKAREGGWESDREGGKRVTKCSNLKTKPAKKQNIPREMLERCDERSLELGELLKTNSCIKRICVRGRPTVHKYTIHGGYFVIVCRSLFCPCNTCLNRQIFYDIISRQDAREAWNGAGCTWWGNCCSGNRVYDSTLYMK